MKKIIGMNLRLRTAKKVDGGDSNTVTQATKESDCTDFDVKHDSRLRIAPVTNMNNELKVGAEPILNKDNGPDSPEQTEGTS